MPYKQSAPFQSHIPVTGFQFRALACLPVRSITTAMNHHLTGLTLAALLLSGCTQEEASTPAQPVKSGLTAITNDYVALNAAEVQRELISDQLQRFFFADGLNGAWTPDPDLNQSEVLQGLNDNLIQACSDQIKLQQIHGHYKIHKAYNQNLQASDFFTGFNQCLTQQLGKQTVPFEWRADFSNFHAFQTQRQHPEVLAITKESKRKKSQSKAKPVGELSFDEFKQLLLVLEKVNT